MGHQNVQAEEVYSSRIQGQVARLWGLPKNAAEGHFMISFTKQSLFEWPPYRCTGFRATPNLKLAGDGWYKRNLHCKSHVRQSDGSYWKTRQVNNARMLQWSVGKL